MQAFWPTQPVLLAAAAAGLQRNTSGGPGHLCWVAAGMRELHKGQHQIPLPIRSPWVAQHIPPEISTSNCWQVTPIGSGGLGQAARTGTLRIWKDQALPPSTSLLFHPVHLAGCWWFWALAEHAGQHRRFVLGSSVQSFPIWSTLVPITTQHKPPGPPSMSHRSLAQAAAGAWQAA